MFELSKHFELTDIPDLTGKVAIITGANTGIGKVCALEMARKNCHVIFACRSENKTLPVIEEIKATTGNDKLEFIPIDLMSLKSVQAFITDFKSKYSQLHVLLNNAGLMGASIKTSEDGLDSQFATNHLAHFYLTTQLLPILKRSDTSRVVNVSSLAHKFYVGAYDFEGINKIENHGAPNNYCTSKGANILFTIELSKRLEAQGIKNIFVNCNHPGNVRSEIFRNLMALDSIAYKIYDSIMNISPEKGALTQLYLATSPEVEQNNIKGKYYIPYAKPATPAAQATSEKNALDLWNFSEMILKEKIPEYEGAGI